MEVTAGQVQVCQVVQVGPGRQRIQVVIGSHVQLRQPAAGPHRLGYFLPQNIARSAFNAWQYEFKARKTKGNQPDEASIMTSASQMLFKLVHCKQQAAYEASEQDQEQEQTAYGAGSQELTCNSQQVSLRTSRLCQH